MVSMLLNLSLVQKRVLSGSDFRLPMTNDGALQKALHTFGQIESESLTGGKRKKGSKFQFKQQVLQGEGTNCEEAVLHQVNEMFP